MHNLNYASTTLGVQSSRYNIYGGKLTKKVECHWSRRVGCWQWTGSAVIKSAVPITLCYRDQQINIQVFSLIQLYLFGLATCFGRLYKTFKRVYFVYDFTFICKSKYCTLFVFMFVLKLQLVELEHSEMWLRKPSVKMIIKLPPYETLEKLNRCKFFFKCCLDRTVCSPVYNLADCFSHHSS
jgi:hypothetical protein